MIMEVGGFPISISPQFILDWTDNFKRELGNGSFGKVYEGIISNEDKSEVTRVAVKKFYDYMKVESDNDLPSISTFSSMKREIAILSLYSHKNIVKLIGYCLPPEVTLKSEGSSPKLAGGQLCLIYELGNKGSIESVLSNDTSAKDFDWKKRMRVALEVASAVNYLHNKFESPVYHRDLKSANVILKGESFSSKLIDCGLSKLHPDYYDSTGEMSMSASVSGGADTFLGTRAYASPEYSQGFPYNVTSEIYCFGMVLMELLTGKIQGSIVEGKRVHFAHFTNKNFLLPPDVRAGAWNVDCVAKLKEICLR
jgi:serine/threonine protein kinase